jgi:hypothetical protein
LGLLREKTCNLRQLCYYKYGIQSFGVVGSIPDVDLFLIIAVFSLLAFIAGKLKKEVNMKRTGKKKMSKTKTIETRLVANIREYGAEFLHCLAEIGTGWTIWCVPPTLSRIA